MEFCFPLGRKGYGLLLNVGRGLGLCVRGETGVTFLLSRCELILWVTFESVQGLRPYVEGMGEISVFYWKRHRGFSQVLRVIPASS